MLLYNKEIQYNGHGLPLYSVLVEALRARVTTVVAAGGVAPITTTTTMHFNVVVVVVLCSCSLSSSTGSASGSSTVLKPGRPTQKHWQCSSSNATLLRACQ